MSFSAKDLSGVGEPLGKLVDAVRAATGVLYEPTRIRREAKANSDAGIILTNMEIQKSDLARRAAQRLAFEETRRQQNIEAIVSLAAEALPEKADKNPVDQDWINYFFNESKDISDENLQKLWGRVLAGEVSSPGKFSRRVLSALKTFSHEDAVTVEWLREVAFYPQDSYLGFLPRFREAETFIGDSVNMGAMIHLANIGVLSMEDDMIHEFSKDEENLVTFGDKTFRFKIKRKALFELPVFIVTRLGIEMISMSKRSARVELVEIIQKKYNDDLEIVEVREA